MNQDEQASMKPVTGHIMAVDGYDQESNSCVLALLVDATELAASGIDEGDVVEIRKE